MKRRPPIVLILLLLVAGAIVNVAVAWGCAARPPEFNTFRAAAGPWPRQAPSTWKMSGPDFFTEWKGFGVQERQWMYVEENYLPRIGVLNSGWPATAMTCHSLDAEWFDSAALANERQIPLRPIWPGFAINTVFYAFILWLLFAGPFALRRLRGDRRIKRGLCPKCAYPVGTNVVCTECGAAVTPRRGENPSVSRQQSSAPRQESSAPPHNPSVPRENP